MAALNHPLENIRVIDLGSHQAGPRCAQVAGAILAVRRRIPAPEHAGSLRIQGGGARGDRSGWLRPGQQRSKGNLR